MKNLIYIMLVGVMALSSCQKEEEVGAASIEKMAGEWFLRYSIDGGKTFSDEYYHYSTYNTAANNGKEMWLDDLGSYWEVKGKMNIDLNAKTFSGSNVANGYYDSFITITDGKILEKAAKASGSKTVTDSIYFKLTYSDDDDEDQYIWAGYKKTGFLEDEH